MKNISFVPPVLRFVIMPAADFAAAKSVAELRMPQKKYPENLFRVKKSTLGILLGLKKYPREIDLYLIIILRN